MSWPPVKQLSDDVKSGKTTAVEQTQKALKLIEENKDFNAVLRINENAIEDAKAVDKRIQEGEDVGSLAGVPYLAKDNLMTNGVETTAASNILKGYIPPFNATVIELLESQGAIMVGKTNLDAFAHGSSTENSDYGPTLNPIDKTRVPGGSSGGSAAAVALDLVPFALGTDTGGSIRQPASFCGVVGFKPTYGSVSRYGAVAMASSTDVIGPITKNIDDAKYVYEIIKGQDWQDSTTIEISKDQNAVALKGLRVGVVAEYMTDSVDPEILKLVNDKIEWFKKSGAVVSEVSLPSTKSALAVYYIVVPAEVSSNLSRYDGMRYGPRSVGKTLEETYFNTRSDGFNAENKRRILIGTYVLSSGYYDAYYNKAQQARTLIVNEFESAFKNYDILIGPTTPTTAFKLGEKDKDPIAMYMSDVMTVASSLVGLPAISLNFGFDKLGLPVGIQIMSSQKDDLKLLDIAKLVEGAE